VPMRCRPRNPIPPVTYISFFFRLHFTPAA
jgi:hypothetical protein